MLLEGNLTGVQHLGIPVVDLNNAVNWYTNILGFQVFYETVIEPEEGKIKVAYLKLGDMVIELYQLPDDKLEEIKSRGDGNIDYVAIHVSDYNSTLYYVNLIGPNKEKIQLQQIPLFYFFNGKINKNGWSHLGLVVSNIDESENFYMQFGFKELLSDEIITENGIVKISYLEKDNFIIKLNQPTGKYLEEVKLRKDGHIDHITFCVLDVEKAFAELKTLGFEVLQNKPVFLPFFENGVKYFNVLGPDGERLEFNQIL